MNKVVNVFPPIRAESERIPRKNTKLFAGNVIAMVPVRAGSTRVPQKNTRPFGNTSLLRLKLTLLKKLQGLKEIVVSTDCEVSADIAIQEGVKIQWRNKYYAGSEVTNDVMDGKQSAVWLETLNRIHVQKSIIQWCLK